jgi:hypothetical protein
MGRRNREHKVIVSQVQNNQIQQEIIECHSLYEALNFAKIHDQEHKSVQIFDILGTEVHIKNKHILDFIPEEISEEKIEKIKIQPEELKQDIPVEIIETSIEPVKELVETTTTKPAIKKPATAKKPKIKKSVN